MAKKTGIIIGAGAGLVGLVLLATRAKAAPPIPEPEPGTATLYGKVIDAQTQQALSGVLVALDGIEVHTDGNGDYVIENLEPKGYVVEFSKAGYETAVY